MEICQNTLMRERDLCTPLPDLPKIKFVCGLLLTGDGQ